MNEFKLNCETSGVRLDKFISDANIDLSRSAAVNLIENGAVLVNDSVVSKKYKLSQGDIVVVNVPDPTPYGNLKKDEGTVDAPIGRNPKDRKKMCVIEKNSKNAVTHYSVITRYKGYTHIKCKLETGRTHQIRVHMAYIGHPVSGDKVYGVKNEKVDFEGQCLHARKIGFIHPKTNEYIEFTSELPDYFKKYLKKLENISSH